MGLRCVECRAGTIYLSASLEWMAGLYRIFFSLALVVAGMVLLKWGRGDMSFLSFSSLFCHFIWRLDVCGKILYSINRVSLVESWFFRDFVFYKLLIFLNLLQVVQAE